MNREKIARKIYSKYSFDLIRNKMHLLGTDDINKTINFLNLRLITSIIIFFMIIYFIDWGYIFGPIIVTLYYFFLPDFTIDVKIKNRRHKLEYEAMYFFLTVLNRDFFSLFLNCHIILFFLEFLRHF